MFRARPFALAASLLWTLLSVALSPVAAPAQSIDFSLNVFYATPSNVNSGGTWELVAKSGGSGIAGVDLHLQGIQSATLEAPRGTINGNQGAGFNLFVNATFPNFTIGQTQPSGAQKGAFYGVGTLINGSPNYPGQAMGTNSLGPSLTTLTAPQDVPWATGDIFGNASWNTAARLLSGTFAANVTPAFAAGNSGNIFSTIGNISAFGDIIAATSISTIVRTNFAPSADYNHNGFVDAADYVLWRKTKGNTVTAGTGADGSNNGTIDQPDYDLWRAAFGKTVPGSGAGGGLSTSNVPEPTTLVVGAIAMALSLLTIRTRRHAFHTHNRIPMADA